MIVVRISDIELRIHVHNLQGLTAYVRANLASIVTCWKLIPVVFHNWRATVEPFAFLAIPFSKIHFLGELPFLMSLF